MVYGRFFEQEIMEQFVETYDTIDVVVSENNNMAFGAIKAIKGGDGQKWKAAFWYIARLC